MKHTPRKKEGLTWIKGEVNNIKESDYKGGEGTVTGWGGGMGVKEGGVIKKASWWERKRLCSKQLSLFWIADQPMKAMEIIGQAHQLKYCPLQNLPPWALPFLTLFQDTYLKKLRSTYKVACSQAGRGGALQGKKKERKKRKKEREMSYPSVFLHVSPFF